MVNGEWDLLLSGFLLAGHGLFRTLALASVASGVLSPNGKSSSMALAAIGADFHQAANIGLNFAAQVAFDLEIAIDDLAKVADFGFAKIPYSPGGIHACPFHDLPGIVLADAID